MVSRPWHCQILRRDRVAGVGEAVRKSLEAMGVIGGRQVTLLEGAVQPCEVDVAGTLVGEEVITNARPGRVSIDDAPHDELEEGTI